MEHHIVAPTHPSLAGSMGIAQGGQPPRSARRGRGLGLGIPRHLPKLACVTGANWLFDRELRPVMGVYRPSGDEVNSTVIAWLDTICAYT